MSSIREEPIEVVEAGAEQRAREQRLMAGLGRFPAATFHFDPRMAEGWLSDRYFVRAAATAEHAGRDPEVTLQIFAKQTGVVAGIYEVIRMLQTQLAPGYDYRDLVVETLLEGDSINERGSDQWETVMHVTGKYRALAHLETPYLGVLARRTLVASNTAAAIKAARGKPLIFMAARHDDWRVQVADGYAALVGGASSVSSDAGGSWWGARGVGTMPHALIAAFGGDTVEATLAFARYVRDREPDTAVISLVDYDNDVVQTSLNVARAMKREFGPGALQGVRVDTSERLIDRSLIEDPALYGRAKLSGVNPYLVRKLRANLDRDGYSEVGIWVSGGFHPAKIKLFEDMDLPVAGYGVGSSLIGHNRGEGGLLSEFDFTADIVRLDGEAQAKKGRAFQGSHRLVRLDWDALARADAESAR